MHPRDLQRIIAAEQFPHQINIGVGDEEELVMVACVGIQTHIILTMLLSGMNL